MSKSIATNTQEIGQVLMDQAAERKTAGRFTVTEGLANENGPLMNVEITYDEEEGEQAMRDPAA